MSDMDAKLQDLQQRLDTIEAAGGPDRVARQRERGKMTARERLAHLFDPGSFMEIDAFVTHRGTGLGMAGVEAPADAVVTGTGTIDGRTVFAFAQDFTVLGGT